MNGKIFIIQIGKQGDILRAEIRQISDTGSENSITARLGIQTYEILKPLGLSKEIKDSIYEILGVVVKDRLITCYKIYCSLTNELIKIDTDLNSNPGNYDSKLNTVQIPYILELNEKCETFLYQSKLCLRDLCKIFDILCGKKFDAPRFDDILKWSKSTFGKQDQLTELIASDHQGWIRKIISMRNAVEHPKGYSGILTINNIKYVNHGENEPYFQAPTWKLNDELESDVTKDMFAFVNNALEFSEELFIVLLTKSQNNIPVIFHEIPENERNENCPMRFKVLFNSTIRR